MKRLDRDAILSVVDEVAPFPIIEKTKVNIVLSETSCETGKVCYPTITNVQKAQKLLKNKHHKGCEWYKCGFCGQYHLTTSKKKKKINNN